MKLQVIKLENNKFWIELCSLVWNGDSERTYITQNEWTAHYKPLERVELIEHATNELLELKVKEYMIRYGWQNVRGGEYSDFQIWKPEFLMQKDECWLIQQKPKTGMKKVAELAAVNKPTVSRCQEYPEVTGEEKLLYILKLDQERFYCSTAKNMEFLKERLKRMRYPDFVTKSKTIEVVKVIPFVSDKTKNTLRYFTLKLMQKKGWQNVRGSEWQGDTITCPKELTQRL